MKGNNTIIGTLLLPMTTDNISLNAIYRWASLSVGYQHIKNKVFYQSIPYSEDNPSVVLFSYTNQPAYDFCFASLTLSPKVGFWSPQLSGQFMKQWIELETHEGIVSANKPIFSMVWRNNFKLPEGFLFDANLYWQTKGNMENAYMIKNTWKNVAFHHKNFLSSCLAGMRTLYCNSCKAFLLVKGAVRWLHHFCHPKTIVIQQLECRLHG